MIPINDRMDSLQTAAAGAITDYADVNVRGYLKEHPDIVAHRLDLLDDMTREIRAAIAREKAAGQWQPLPESVALIEHTELTTEYANHTCNCEYCRHAA